MRDAPDVLRRTGTQAAVVDQLSGGLSGVVNQMDLPLIHVANALPVNWCDCVFPPMVGWPYRSGLLARLRNHVASALLRHLTRPVLARYSDYYRRHGIPFDFEGPNSGFSRLAQIAQLPAAFDFPNPELPPWFHHTGPFHDGQGRAEAGFPWDKLSSEPLIYASMGTVQNGFEHVFRTIAEACSDLGCQLVMSIGPILTLDAVGRLAGNCIAVTYAPQLELLRRAALCITHAGLNTALESLAAGVPMVAIPVTNDQPGVAAASPTPAPAPWCPSAGSPRFGSAALSGRCSAMTATAKARGGYRPPSKRQTDWNAQQISSTNVWAHEISGVAMQCPRLYPGPRKRYKRWRRRGYWCRRTCSQR